MPKLSKIQLILPILCLMLIGCNCLTYTYWSGWIVRQQGGSTGPVLNCDNLRLTSPLGGLPNGLATFYWDALENAMHYRINLYASGVQLASFDAVSGQTNLDADVSTTAVGGGQALQVELVAISANGEQCAQSTTIQREWSAPPPPPADQPLVQVTPDQ